MIEITSNQIKEAKKLCIKKWKIIVENDGSNEHDKLYDFNKFKYGCPYCSLFVKKDVKGYEYCDGCPIDLPKEKYNYNKFNIAAEDPWMGQALLKGCCQKKHPWYKWDKNPTAKTAQKVLDLIIKS